MLVVRGIMVHCAVWLMSCLVHPFIWSGLSRYTVLGLIGAPLGFAIGLPLLLVGSAVWMAPFLIPILRRYDGLGFYLWVALDGAVAVLCASELGTLGDPRPSIYQYYTPAIIAFVLGILFAFVSATWPQRVQGLTKRWSERPPAVPPPLP